MKLKTNINKNNIFYKKKILNYSLNKLKCGDYIRIQFLAHNQKRRGGSNLRLNQQTVILIKKNHKYASLSFLVTSLFRHEKVHFRYLISSPHVIKILFIKKALTFRKKFFK